MPYEPTEMPSDMELEDWIPVLEPMEENSSLERHANMSLPEYINKRESGELENLKDPLEEGRNRSVFYHENRNSSITTKWGPRQIEEDSLMAEGFLDYTGEFEGDTVAEVEEEIARQHSAPYLNLIEYDGGEVGMGFKLPQNYNQEEWEDTVDTLVAIIDELDQYQADLEAVSDQYPE